MVPENRIDLFCACIIAGLGLFSRDFYLQFWMFWLGGMR